MALSLSAIRRLIMKVDYSAALSDHNVRKIRRDEGELTQVLGLRMNWKVKAKDTGYAFSVYEMELAPGQGIPLHTGEPRKDANQARSRDE
jgi:hypothetical protein